MANKGVVLRYGVYDTAAGNITIVVNDGEVIRILFGSYDPPGMSNEENTVLFDAIMEINQYFFGQRKKFDVPFKIEGTDFAKKVYTYLLTIPYGETRTENDVLEAIEEKKSRSTLREVLENNPIPLVIPSHRVLSPQPRKNDTVDFDMTSLLVQMEKEGKRYRPGKYLHPSL